MTIVASIMAYSVSGSSAMALKKLSKSPLPPNARSAFNVLPARERAGISRQGRRPKLPDHSLDKQPIAEFAIAANMSGTGRQQFFNLCELVAAQP